MLNCTVVASIRHFSETPRYQQLNLPLGVQVQLVFYLLYGNMQVAFAFLLSCFFTSSRTTNVATWIWVLGSGLFAGNLLDAVFAANRWWSLPVQFIPTAGAYRYDSMLFI